MNRVVAAVPTLGQSVLLGECLAALRAQSELLEIVLVCPRASDLGELAGAADRTVETSRPLGFAAATNAGWRAARAEWLAAINDDAVLEPGWLDRLLEEGARSPRAAALQGVNLMHEMPRLSDGCGIAWNRWLQAVQIGHLAPAPPEDEPARAIFGVSATAAIFRRSALAEVAPDGEPFEARFGSYYEDVELALRLRAAGWEARLVPAARVRHAGGLTGARRPVQRTRLLYSNRLWTLRRALGPGLWRELPLIGARDFLDALRALSSGRMAEAAGIALAWPRALPRLFARSASASRLGADELRSWSEPP